MSPKPLKEFADKTDEEGLLQTAELRRRNSTIQNALNRALAENVALSEHLDLITEIETAHPKPPKWATPRKTKNPHQATLCLMLSDLHFDEVVRPEQVDHINTYDRRIAELRLKRTCERAIILGRDYLAGFKYDGMSLMLGGDIFSGNIHDELKETNAGTLMESVIHWLEQMEAACQLLASEFGNLHISGVVGNHGRFTKKPRHKNRAQDNVEWLLYKLMQRDLTKIEGVTMTVSEAPDLLVPIYDTTFLLTHGDQFRGGSGISGALSPLLLGSHRKTRRQAAAGRPYDVMVMGHFHQYMSLPSKGLLINGSLVGYNEFAYNHNFEPEPPQQALWVVTPEFGVSFSAPVFSMDRDKEGW